MNTNLETSAMSTSHESSAVNLELYLFLLLLFHSLVMPDHVWSVLNPRIVPFFQLFKLCVSVKDLPNLCSNPLFYGEKYRTRFLIIFIFCGHF